MPFKDDEKRREYYRAYRAEKREALGRDAATGRTASAAPRSGTPPAKPCRNPDCRFSGRTSGTCTGWESADPPRLLTVRQGRGWG